MQLAVELAVATLMVAVIIAIHLGGIDALMKLLRRHRALQAYGQRLLHEGGAIVPAEAGLFVLHAIEIWLYAGSDRSVGSLPGLEPSLYCPPGSYETVGYRDIVLSEEWRVVGAIESAKGIIVLGWSTAFRSSRWANPRPEGPNRQQHPRAAARTC